MEGEGKLDAISNSILSFIDILDSYGAASWSLRSVAFTSLAILMGLQIQGKVRGVYWHGVVNALITGIGSAMCVYLDVFASDAISGTAEPLRSIRCEGPLTSLHRLLPAVLLGYAAADVIDALHLGSDFLVHGLSVSIVMGVVCELGLSHHVTPMLLMEVSSIFLNLGAGDFIPDIISVMIQLIFVILFFLVRIVVVPYIWFVWVKTFHEEQTKAEKEMCFPHWFIYIVLVFGIIFHTLNLYWMYKIVKRVKRKLSGKAKMADGSINGEPSS
eukprot:CAMPEP_0195511940 /NCGR_PEP_ID=MMETSP0794_2-20130614/4084_1 /TAXON_ID=515487 /ORGANISM="Stephanopyxis turris, Strain CCMP 815" /LENGTH=271 /DNA_ID=CAMNT_0040639631 /DNA_START=122 /DNA_END=937 /DNA_ORIENTATION=-